MKWNLDGLGVAASLACAIHCAVLPLLFTSLPLLGLDIIHNRAFEHGMIALAFIIGVLALRSGFRKHHHGARPLVLLTVGFGFLIGKEFVPGHPGWMVLLAVIFIVSAHYINYRLCRRAESCGNTECSHPASKGL